MGSWFSVTDIGFADTDVGYRTVFDNTVEAAASVIRSQAGHVCIITGAGISSHVLPTFRSNEKNALWDVMDGPILMKEKFYDRPLEAWLLAANVLMMQVKGILRPSPAHRIIHELMTRGFVSHVLTQNVDSLHDFPGRVVELHGCVTEFGECEKCGAIGDVDHHRVVREKVIPKCEICGTILKPPVALFGDKIPNEVRVEAKKALDAAYVICLMGTHCAVDPVLSFVQEAKRKGVIIIEINTETTVATPFADISLRGTCDDVCSEIIEILVPGLERDWAVDL